MEMLVIDTETTGLYPKINKTLTVGLLYTDIEKDFLKIINSKHILVKHENYNVDPEALIVNKINLNEHHKIALSSHKACKKINNFIEKNNLQKTTLLGHNINFDIRFLQELFKQGDSISLLPKEYTDTMHLWDYMKRKNLISFQLRNNLQTLAEFFNVDYTKSHSALGDCQITANVYQKMINMLS
jgi:DNA polymerase-3 subunit epsilon/ribonuclease T